MNPVALAPALAIVKAPQAGQQLGRFRLLTVLGRGAQAVVWRALDERLQRDVALKLMRTDCAAATQGLRAEDWLHEARAVGRLAHAHVVPVFEADHLDGWPVLVFELVEGPTLAQFSRDRGPLPAREAVDLMLGVVDALRAAHAQGIVHRDLKPSNILVDADGRARVMDFGIAAPLAQVAGEATCQVGRVVGSPGYLSPEAASGQAASPQMDVFAAGMVLAELIAGAPLMVERDMARALHRVQHEDMLVPDNAAVDDRLRAVLQRAIARDPTRRYDSAAQLRDALLQWLQPPEGDTAAVGGGGHGTLDFLLRRMRQKTDFPALSDRVLRIQRMANSDSESLHHLADEILKDVALTQKLLRLVNTAHFRREPQGVASVSRAVALVGLAGIRNLALSLVLVEHMKDKAHAQRLKECFLRALLAAELAQALMRQVSPASREAEDAFLGAMFCNLGPLLAEYYFPDEAQAIREQLARSSARHGGPTDKGAASPTRLHLQQQHAATQVLGLSYEALGLGVARSWSLPDSLQRCMSRPDGASPTRRVPAGTEQLRWLAVAANEVADALWQADEQALAQRLDGVLQRHGRALGLDATDLRLASDEARRSLAQMAQAMGLSLPRGQVGAALLQTDEQATLVLCADRSEQDARAPAAAVAAGLDADALRQRSDQAAATINAGIQHITDALSAEVVELNKVLRMVLDTIHRALGCQRVLFCLRDASKQRLVGRFGLGLQAETLSPLFQVPLQIMAGQAGDLFTAVCLKGVDTLVPDRHQPAVAALLPGWYQRQVKANAFLLLPLTLRNAPFALIYADHAQTLPVAERERALLRTLRNQALMAFKQAGL